MKTTSTMKSIPTLRAVALSAMCLCGTAQAQSLDYLQGLLDATPGGGWVKANTNLWSQAWPTGAEAVDVTKELAATRNVVHAWSSMAWDSNRNNLLLWGGGHSSYAGNEMYVWNGSTGAWGLGSLPSRVESVANAVDNRTRLVVDDAAPQSAHTYEGNLFLPVNDMFVTIGGPVYQDAGTFKVRGANGSLVTAGPWLWDPNKANGSQVGGTTGSGWNPATTGGQMWTNQGGSWANTAGLNHFVNNSTAYVQENGQDVVYVTVKPGAWGTLYKYTPGDVRNGSTGAWSLVGVPSYRAASLESSATIDSLNGLYINTAYHPSTIANFDLNVWDLSKAGSRNVDTSVNLVMADGTPFSISNEFGIDFNSSDGTVYMWDGNNRGTLYRTQAAFNADGSIATTWTVDQLLSSTAAQPDGNHRFGVGGKWQYVDALGAFVALDEYSLTTGDAGVWFYKPLVTAVPEPTSVALMLAGLGLVGMRLRRKQPA
ncbi:MAG: PEP-CTERM sorting domain-containing protein [Pseudomonadota bacterium]